jgi:hypothetical protein
MAMKNQVMVIWVVTPCRDVEAMKSSKILVSYYVTTWHHHPEDQKTITWLCWRQTTFGLSYLLKKFKKSL